MPTLFNVSDEMLSVGEDRYSSPQKLDATQNHPKYMRTVNFKQDYVVLILKRSYYSIAKENEENYIGLYQLNNFSSININQNVNGSPGSCNVKIKGGERVVYATRDDQDSKGWDSLQQMISGWLSIDDVAVQPNEDEYIGQGLNWAFGADFWNSGHGIYYRTLMDARLAKYSWRFAEKCDWEPMDEIYIYGKSRRIKNENGEYVFCPLFVGFIDSITKQYSAGDQGLSISIAASDNLKLLSLSYVTNFPAATLGSSFTGGLDISYDREDIEYQLEQAGLKKDTNGCFILGDGFYDSGNWDGVNTKGFSSKGFIYTNIFAGKQPRDYIKKLASQAGIQNKYLTKRIEPVTKTPYTTTLRNGSQINQFNGELKNRLSVCTESAQKLFMEFFCDEEGNIVFKIPSYTVGVNRLPANNQGYEFIEDVIGIYESKIQSTPYEQLTLDAQSAEVQKVASYVDGLNKNTETSIYGAQNQYNVLIISPFTSADFTTQYDNVNDFPYFNTTNGVLNVIKKYDSSCNLNLYKSGLSGYDMVIINSHGMKDTSSVGYFKAFTINKNENSPNGEYQNYINNGYLLFEQNETSDDLIDVYLSYKFFIDTYSSLSNTMFIFDFCYSETFCNHFREKLQCPFVMGYKSKVSTVYSKYMSQSILNDLITKNKTVNQAVTNAQCNIGEIDFIGQNDLYNSNEIASLYCKYKLNYKFYHKG